MTPGWHVNREGQHFGPYSFKQLQEMAAGGGLEPRDLFWAEGIAEWIPADKIYGLFVAAPSTAAPSWSHPQRAEASVAVADPAPSRWQSVSGPGLQTPVWHEPEPYRAAQSPAWQPAAWQGTESPGPVLPGMGWHSSPVPFGIVANEFSPLSYGAIAGDVIPPIAADQDSPPPAWRVWWRGRTSLAISTLVHVGLVVMLSAVTIARQESAELFGVVLSNLNPDLEDVELLKETPDVPVTVTLEALSEAATELTESAAPAADDLDYEAPMLESDVFGDLIAGNGALFKEFGTGNQSGPGGMAGLGEFTRRLNRAGAKTGDVQISLIWNNTNDLDLQVRCPSGEVISFSRKQSTCMGRLDIDQNASSNPVRDPVENIFWSTGAAPMGEFHVFVNYFGNRGGRDPTRFQVAVKVDGDVKIFRGSLQPGDRLREVYAFTRE